MRKLRQLPFADSSTGNAHRGWTVRHAFLSGGGLVTSLLLAAAGWLQLHAPQVPDFNQQGYIAALEKYLAEVTPQQMWRRWEEVYRPMAQRGFQQLTTRQQEELQAAANENRTYRDLFLATAAISAAVTGTALLLVRESS